MRSAPHIATILALCLSVAVGTTARGASLNDLNEAFSNQKWDAAAQIAYEILQRDPNAAEAYLKGAYSMFQKNYPTAALMFLKKMTMAHWRSLPRGQDRFAEIVSLFQKKVPLTLLPGRLDSVNENEVPSYLRDEVIYAKGRAAFENRDILRAKAYLEGVSANSRFYMEARYLLACLAVEQKEYDQAAGNISKIFQPQLFAQASEFWKDITSQMTTHWGASIKVMLDASVLGKARVVGELGNLAMARIRYAKKEFELSLDEYEKVPADSPFLPRAQLERIWALIQLNRHDDARAEAVNLSSNESRFEGIEARILQALILVESGKGAEARKVLDEFEKVYEMHITNLGKYRNFGVARSLPAFIQWEIKTDKRILHLEEYSDTVRAELAQLRSPSQRIFPVYHALGSALDNLLLESKRVVAQITREIVEKRMRDLDELYVQGRLIRAETYLDDREKLRDEFTKLGKVTEDQQKAHDRQLVDMLNQVVGIVDGAFAKLRHRNPYLEFRHSEMLWELSTAYFILAQTSEKQKNEKLGEGFRQKALKLVDAVVRDFPTFPKVAQAKFFHGFALLEIGEEQKGISVLEGYVQSHPTHVHVPDAYRIIGDYYFDRNRFDKAEANFVRILDFPDTPIMGYAYYKIAWCNYNQRSFAKALLALEKAVLWANQSAEKGELSLKREASNDLVSVYAEVGDHHRAMEYFESFLGGNSSTWLESLAKKYDEMGQYEKSTFVYNVLISLNDSPTNGMANYPPIIRGHFRLVKWDDVLKSAREMVENYKDKLLQPQPKGTPAEEAEETLRQVAMGQQFEFGGTEDAAVIDRVIALDNLYLEAFGKWPTAQPLLYKHAYFLGNKKRYAEAVDAYRRHWLQFRDTLKEPLKEEALRNLLHILEAQENQRRKDAAAKEGPTPTPEGTPTPEHDKPFAEMTPEIKDLLTFSREYLQLYPKTKHTRAISFLYGTTLLKYGEIDEGITVSQKIFDDNSKDEFGKNAFKNLKVAYYRKKDWAAANRWAQTMLARSEVDMKAFSSELQTVKEETQFLWASETKDNGESADLFLKLVKDPKANRLREKALYNAIVRYHQSDDKVRVLQFSKELEKLNPKSEFLSLLAGIRATILQEAGDYVGALPFLHALVKTPPKDVTPDVLQQAKLNMALILQALDKTAAAVSLYKEYIEKAPDKGAKGVAQANSGIKYLETRMKRAPASEYKAWGALMAARAGYQKQPLDRKGDLPSRIRSGGQKLEAAVARFTEVASSAETPPFYAFEAICAVPALYVAFANGVKGLAEAVPQEARTEVAAELARIAKPVEEKATKWAGDCLEKSFAAYHDGPIMREVNRVWGWEADAARRDRVYQVLQALEARVPWVWPSGDGRGEGDIIDRHLKKGGDVESWYALARVRLDAKRWGLSRLTFIDTLNKLDSLPAATPAPEGGEGKPVSSEGSSRGRILNALAYIEQATLNPPGITALYEKAAEEGSGFACVNLALIHLKGGRLEPGLESLRRALTLGAFERAPEVKTLVSQVVGP